MKAAEECGKARAGDVVFRAAQNLREGSRLERDTDAATAEYHDGGGNTEVEMALAGLKLEHDDLVRKLEVFLEETEVGGGRELPPNLLAKALENSGKGKGFPFGGGK